MGRGLSELQRRILDILPDWKEGMKCQDAPTRRELVDLLGLEETASNRSSVSRAVSRLYKRKLILHVWGFGRRYTENNAIYGQRTGYARATPLQVEERLARQQAFLANWKASRPTVAT